MRAWVASRQVNRHSGLIEISSSEDFLARKAGVPHALLVADRHQSGGGGRVISGPIFTPDRMQRYCVAHIINERTSADRCRYACSASGTTVAGNNHRCFGCRPACTGCDDRPWGCRRRLLSPSSCNLQWINLRKSATIALICSLVTADRLSYYPTMRCPRLGDYGYREQRQPAAMAPLPPPLQRGHAHSWRRGRLNPRGPQHQDTVSDCAAPPSLAMTCKVCTCRGWAA